jgi:hypothetical protein
MKQRWLNDKQPDENGDLILVIENSQGHRVSTFKAKTIEEITDQVAEAQVQANRQLARLAKPDIGRIPMNAKPREITPAERMRLSADITDPGKIVEAVTEIVTASQGATPETLGKRVAAFDQKEADEYYRKEAEAFVEDYPEYYPVQENQQKIFAALEAAGYDLTRNNIAIIYNRLLDEGKLVLWPEEPIQLPSGDVEPEAEAQHLPMRVAAVAAPPPNPRPRSFSSGLRSSDASASKPAPRKPTPIVTRAEIERMSRAEYNDRIRDPIFRRAVDALA